MILQRLVTSYKYFRELYIAVFVIMVIAVSGSFGYMILEDYTFNEALYMTIITVSTVGFKEVKDLSVQGRYFTIILIITSFGTFAFAISSASKYFFSGSYARYLKLMRMDTNIKKLKNHTIICGSGSNGSEAINRLKNHSRDVIIIEKNADVVEELKTRGFLVVEGDATDEAVLRMAGITNAHSLITTLPRDTDNVFVVLTARELNQDVRIISRCIAESSSSKLIIAGANDIINPDKVGGAHMAGFVINRSITNFIELIGLTGNEDEHIYGASLESLREDIEGKSINDFFERINTECTLIGLLTKEGTYVVNPKRESQLSEASEFFFIGNKDQILDLRDKLKTAH